MPSLPQNDLPPYPWPYARDAPQWSGCDPGPPECLGSTGTVWTFRYSALRTRIAALGAGSEAYETVANAVAFVRTALDLWMPLATTCDQLDDDSDPRLAWITGPFQEEPPPVTLKAIRAGVHAKLGSNEEILHQFHLVPQGSGNLDSIDAGKLVALGDAIRGLWDAWLAETWSGGLGMVVNAFSSQVVYDEVRTSLVEYYTPVLDSGKLRYSNVLIGTQYSSWGTPHAGAGSTCLPWEVALCLTLLTAERDMSSRGRVYLGGLVSGLIETNTGLFNATEARHVGEKFGSAVINGMHTHATITGVPPLDFAIVSTHAHAGHRSSGDWSGPAARGIGGVKVGAVPDSQRRRRRKQPENSYLSWGSAPS